MKTFTFGTLSICCILLNFDLQAANDYDIQTNANITTFINKADVVSYSSNKNSKQFVAQLRNKYNGLKDEQKLNALLQDQNYIEVLNYLWTEPNAKKKIAWLEKKVDEGHPILMFELGQEYYYQDPSLQTYAMKAMPWILAAMRRTYLDTVCTSDKSVSAAPEYLLTTYQQPILADVQNKNSSEQMQKYFSENSKQFQKNSIETLRKVLAPFVVEGEVEIPSPRWVFSHGLASFSNIVNTVPENECDTLRKKEAQDFLVKAKELEQSLGNESKNK